MAARSCFHRTGDDSGAIGLGVGKIDPRLLPSDPRAALTAIPAVVVFNIATFFPFVALLLWFKAANILLLASWFWLRWFDAAAWPPKFTKSRFGLEKLRRKNYREFRWALIRFSFQLFSSTTFRTSANRPSSRWLVGKIIGVSLCATKLSVETASASPCQRFSVTTAVTIVTWDNIVRWFV